MQSRSAYTSGNFELLIDGQPTTAYIKSVDGGHGKVSPVTEPVGPWQGRIKHNGPLEIEPISLELGLSGAKDIMHWIQGSWARKFSRRSGQITHADFDNKSTYEHEFSNALLTEVTFPELNGSSKDPGYLKIKLQPEHVATRKIDHGRKLGGTTMSPKQKEWLQSAFRLTIDGIDDMKYCNKLDSFTITQGVKSVQVGAQRWPQFEPTKLEFPALSGTIALERANKLLKWHDDSVMKGKDDPSQQRSGLIEFLSPDRSKTIFEIELKFVGISGLSVVASQANASEIKRVKFDLYVEHMILASGSGFA